MPTSCKTNMGRTLGGLVLVTSITIASCNSAGNSSVAPFAPRGFVQQRPATIVKGGVPNFSEATDLPLTSDADYERYIDPQVTGSDRRQAMHFMKLMPPNWRGDFVYVDKNNKILSNRIAVKRSVQLTVRRSKARPRTRFGDPPIDDSTGPFVRQFSVPGVTASYGYATEYCNNTSLNPGDAGDMYSGNIRF